MTNIIAKLNHKQRRLEVNKGREPLHESAEGALGEFVVVVGGGDD